MTLITKILLAAVALQAALVGAIDDGDRCGATAAGKNVPGACRPTAACSSFGRYSSYCVQTSATSGEACAPSSAVCGGGLGCTNGACQYATTVVGGYCDYDGECPPRATCWLGYTCRAANTIPNGGGCTGDAQCAASTAGCLSKSDRFKVTSTCGPTNTIPYGGNCEDSGDCTSTYACSSGPTGSTCAVKKTAAMGRRHLQPTQLPLGLCAKGLSACSVKRKGLQVHECIDLANDIEHCGSCSNSCDELDDGMGTLTCSEGKCVPHNTDGSTRTLSNRSVSVADVHSVRRKKQSRTSTGNDVQPRRRASKPKRHL